MELLVTLAAGLEFMSFQLEVVSTVHSSQCLSPELETKLGFSHLLGINAPLDKGSQYIVVPMPLFFPV